MGNRGEDIPNRRGFFRHAVTRVIGPIADYMENLTARRPASVLLRPPGAIEESAFLQTCHRCEACVKACPADAIYLLGRDAGEATGTPVIDPDRSPCVVCDGLHCTHVCESGALAVLNAPSLIRMGTAEVYETLCVRSGGEECSLCVDRCPMGEDALYFLGDGPPMVKLDGCVGCGVCQHVCPTSPKAIVVKPNARR